MTSTTSPARSVPIASVHSSAGKYLTVTMDGEAYGFAVLKIREIIRMQKITPVPQMPEFVRGVVNLRGRVLPVIDLRIKFGLKAGFTDRTCIVVAQTKRPGGQTAQMGLIVDTVEEVVTLSGAEIESPPDFGSKVSTSYLLGMAQTKGRVKTLLDLDQIVSPETVASLAELRNRSLAEG